MVSTLSGLAGQYIDWKTPIAMHYGLIETVSPEGTFCDTVQIPSSAGDMELN